MKHYDVIVIGGGHAGTEAAAASARRGAATLLITIKLDAVGTMSCNPAIGGLGKGHLVREVDALDGIMGRAADSAGIQFRLLNRKKGPAVQGPRLQADRNLYKRAVQLLLSEQTNLTQMEGEVAALLFDKTTVGGVQLTDGSEIRAKAVVLTAGTFLNGRIHIGDESWSAGRMDEKASRRLAEQLNAGGMVTGRLKTGTPPRLDGTTIDWEQLETQEGDVEPTFLSFMSSRIAARQVSCGITHTNTQTHDIVRENLHRSAMYGGHIEGVGPRYCPSLEDKVVRFAEKQSHQIFLEPESLTSNVIYPNGISTSLPASVQVEYVTSIAGLENARILQPGYAIEYDYLDPRNLHISLETKSYPRLFLAGQINGTTGYEEAAAQGCLAGANAAAAALDLPRLEVSRTESYIGVMIDDLTNFGVTEPYRMFTSRAEFRLSVRADNADQRLCTKGRALGLIGEKRWAQFQMKSDQIERGREALRSPKFSSRHLHSLGFPLSVSGPNRSLYEVLAFAETDASSVSGLSEVFSRLDPTVQALLETEAKYANYLERESMQAEKIRKDEDLRFPGGFLFGSISGISAEITGKLTLAQPATMAAAKRIEGMTPSAVLILLSAIKQSNCHTPAA